MEDKYFNTVCQALENEDFIELQEVLQRLLPQVSEKEMMQQSQAGRTLLHQVCAKGSVDMAQGMLKACPDLITLAENSGFYPYHFAHNRKMAKAVIDFIPEMTQAEKLWTSIESGYCYREMLDRKKVHHRFTVTGMVEMLNDPCAGRSLCFIERQLEEVEDYLSDMDGFHNIPPALDDPMLQWLKNIHSTLHALVMYIKMVGSYVSPLVEKRERSRISKCLKTSVKLMDRLKEIERQGCKRLRGGLKAKRAKIEAALCFESLSLSR